MFKKLGVLFVLTVLIISFLRQFGCEGIPYLSKPIVDTVILIDTLYERHDSVIYSKPKVLKIEIHDTLPAAYLPNSNYDVLKNQYQELAKDYLAKRFYTDTIRIGSFGTIAINDTVSNNQILGRNFVENYSIPTIEKTVRIREQLPPKTKVFAGVGFISNPVSGRIIYGDLQLITKKDQSYSFQLGIDNNIKPVVGAKISWKLKFK